MRLILALAALAAAAACSPLSDAPRTGPMTDATTSTPRAQAERLIGEVARRQGRDFAGLPSSNLIAYGPVSFRYEPGAAAVFAAVLLVELDTWTTYPEDRPAIERTLAGLRDPAIGGLFDTGGGEWVFERDTGRLHLAVRRPVTADPAELKSAFERIQRVAPDWRMTWFAKVADIVHEGAPPPRERVTVERNPYRQD